MGLALKVKASNGRNSCLGVGVVLCLLACTAVTAHPWDNTRLSSEQRAALLNRELTLDERISMVHGPMALPINNTQLPPEAILAAGYIPGVRWR